jgi:phosphoribosylformylglycinamidine synthase
MEHIKRIYVEKKKPFDIEAEHLFYDLKENLGVINLTGLRLLNRYDISGITDDEYKVARTTIFSEPPVDIVYDEEIHIGEDETVIAIEYLPGQYDQRADSAAQCIQIITLKKRPVISAARIVILKGTISTGELLKIKNYLINPVDSREAVLTKPEKLLMDFDIPEEVEILKGFTNFSDDALEEFRISRQLAMSFDDLHFCQEYFRQQEKRDPFITEIKMLDTYWSDHCRHTTFETRIKNVEFENSPFTLPIKKAFEKYLNAYKTLYPQKAQDTDICLMNIAQMSMKELRKKGQLEDMEISAEVNACSIIREVTVNGKKEEWLVMFKNETHNHPTEIEPFGGAATCLGGAIRDPLSGRAYVYQAMRVTGSGNPHRKIQDTLPGKLPQRKITTEAAHGYSSYGNQIGVPTGIVSELYHDGYIAKRMEVGAVIGAVPRKHVIREEPAPADVILLVGGRTGRDGIGGATGSSKTHTEDSIYTAGAEVQKGNPPEERKLQRLFRNPDACRLIKRSNDFGAGGVSVAIGELAGGLEIFLDKVPKKYEGLDGTELALSESQERMAVVISPENVEKFKSLAKEENLEATEIAYVTDGNRLKMYWRDAAVVDISREFINTHGVRQETEVKVTAPDENNHFFYRLPEAVKQGLKTKNIKTAWLENLKDLNIGSQRGLVERFDSTVGGGTVLMPFGGKYQFTPTEAMAAKIPIFSDQTQAPGDEKNEGWKGRRVEGEKVRTLETEQIDDRGQTTEDRGQMTVETTSNEKFLQGGPGGAVFSKSAPPGGRRQDTATATLMSYGFNPEISTWSSFHGAVYAVVEAVTRIVATGGNYQTVRTSLQEYFEKLGKDKTRWGKPFSALLGAYYALTELGIPSIGGKDSMSGSFEDLDVPPTLIAFAVDTVYVNHVISPEFKESDSAIIYIKLERDEFELPKFDKLKKNCSCISQLIKEGKILSAQTVRNGGIAAAVSKMAFGNKIGLHLTASIEPDALFTPDYGSFLLEINGSEDIEALFRGIDYLVLGHTLEEPVIRFGYMEIDIDEARSVWETPLEPIFPTRTKETDPEPYSISYSNRYPRRPSVKIARPRVLIPAFPGTNCEYETQAAFERAGAIADTFVFRNLTPSDLDESLGALKKKIQNSQIIVIPGGFSAGDEPDGSGKFIAAVSRNPHIKDAIMSLLNERDGLMLGICNGFQALVKLGLIPFGEIRDLEETSPTLTFNRIGRHISRMVRTQIVSVLSPWFIHHKPGDIHFIPASHGEGRFIASPGMIKQLMEKGQIATQYVDMEGNPTMNVNFNPNGSMNAVEGVTSTDGRVLGKMGHTERISSNTAINIPGDKNQKLFQSGVDYFS